MTATNPGGSGSATSGQTAMVSSSSGGPANTAVPVVTGSPDISSFVAPQLVATTGSWSGSPSSYRLGWEDCNSSGAGCVNGQGVAFGPGASGSACTITTALDGCSYNLTANEYNACPAAGGSGACVIKLVVTATNGTGSTPVTVSVGTVTDSGASNPWPNYSNTGYQNTPADFDSFGNESYTAATGGTEGVPNPNVLTVASASSSSCPTTLQSNHTYAFCWYKNTCSPGASCNGSTLGHSGSPVSNVKFIGDLFDADSNGPSAECGGTYCDNNDLTMYCSGGCVFDYDTFKPYDLAVPDQPMPNHTTAVDDDHVPIAHGTTYVDGYGIVCACGSGTQGNGFTFEYDDMWGYGSGIVVGTNSSSTPNLIENNWLHDTADCDDDRPTCTEHPDGIGMVNTGSSSSYVTLNHNNMPFANGDTNDIAFQSGTYNHLTITNNVLAGDGYMTAVWGSSSDVTFTGNVWTNYAEPLYGPLYLGQDFWTTSGSAWAHNKFEWDPTGVSPFYQWGPGNGDADPATASQSGMCWVPTTSDSQNNLSTTDYGGGTCYVRQRSNPASPPRPIRARAGRDGLRRGRTNSATPETLEEPLVAGSASPSGSPLTPRLPGPAAHRYPRRGRRTRSGSRGNKTRSGGHRLLLITASCDGEDVGEAWVGFQWASRLAARHDVTLLTMHRRDEDTAISTDS